MNLIYPIHRWDPVIFGKNSTIALPMIYIIPDDKFLLYARNSSNSGLVIINNSNTIYDNKKMLGWIQMSYNTPNCRVNFYNKNKYVVIILASKWNEYPDPDKLGCVTLLDPNEIDSSNQEKKNNIPSITKKQLNLENYKENNEINISQYTDHLNTKNLKQINYNILCKPIYIFIIIILIIIIIFTIIISKNY
jgi:hypothetical protein